MLMENIDMTDSVHIKRTTVYMATSWYNFNVAMPCSYCDVCCWEEVEVRAKKLTHCLLSSLPRRKLVSVCPGVRVSLSFSTYVCMCLVVWLHQRSAGEQRTSSAARQRRTHRLRCEWPASSSTFLAAFVRLSFRLAVCSVLFCYLHQGGYLLLHYIRLKLFRVA